MYFLSCIFGRISGLFDNRLSGLPHPVSGRIQDVKKGRIIRCIPTSFRLDLCLRRRRKRHFLKWHLILIFSYLYSNNKSCTFAHITKLKTSTQITYLVILLIYESQLLRYLAAVLRSRSRSEPRFFGWSRSRFFWVGSGSFFDEWKTKWFKDVHF